MMNLVPIIQPEAETPVQAQLPLCREVAWDFARGVPVYAGGRPVEVTGVEAVRVWIWKALKTARFHQEIYTGDYGCEAEPHRKGRHCPGQGKRGGPVCSGGPGAKSIHPGGPAGAGQLSGNQAGDRLPGVYDLRRSGGSGKCMKI